MDYMGSHDLFDHLLTPAKKQRRPAAANWFARIRRLLLPTHRPETTSTL
ncbi:hypothetical protein [Geothermobacter hydrogeniphilus]|nr:hypothetical protein [Geothermobacter hydrogeniphilus]